MYVIKRGNYYVANPGSKNSYTNKIEKARKFRTKEEAEKDKCGNETVINLSNILSQQYEQNG